MIKNSEKILRVLWEENKQFLSLIGFFVKFIILEKKIIEDQYSAIFSNEYLVNYCENYKMV